MNNKIETKNATITSTTLGYEDHGIFTFWLFLKYSGSGQAAGGYSLDSYNKQTDGRVGYPYGIDLIARILAVVGVRSWEDLKGKHIRVRASYDKVHAIGHLLDEEWLDFKEFFDERREGE